jgi:hypothetical protein
MKKNRLPLITLIIGIILVITAWSLDYPLAVESLNDTIFNHISTLYWIGLSLILGSLFLIGYSFKNPYIKWLTIIGIVLAIYSLNNFYFMLPGSDQATFRGLNEYFIKTNNMDPTIGNHSYFNWPLFFLLVKMVTSITGMPLTAFEFLMFSITGILFATTLYVYASRFFKETGFVAVIAFFLIMFNFLNYQVVPFALAFSLLLIIFMLESRESKRKLTSITAIILFTGIALIHPFVPLFYILYLLASLLFSRKKETFILFVITIGIYLSIQFSQPSSEFISDLTKVFTFESDFAQMVTQVSATTSSAFDQIAQMFSRGTIVMLGLICGIGFIMLFIQKRLRVSDKAILLTGIFYSLAGVVILIFGTRTYPLVIIPITLGLSKILEGRFKRFVICVIAVIMLLFPFVLVHSVSFEPQTMYQTKSDYVLENFFIDHYNLTTAELSVMHVRVMYYIQAKEPLIYNLEDDTFSALFPRIDQYHYVLYTTGLGISLEEHNITENELINEAGLNLVCDSGSAYILVRPDDVK